MADQLSLFDALPEITEPEYGSGLSLDARFAAWVQANPQVLDLFINLALQLVRAGWQHYGAKALVERMRFEYAVRGGDEFKLDNNYTSRLAREAVKRRPELEGFFEFRELRDGQA